MGSFDQRPEINCPLIVSNVYFCCIPEMDMRGNNLVGDIFLKEGLLEEITSFVIYYIELGSVSTSCECVKEFLDPSICVLSGW